MKTKLNFLLFIFIFLATTQMDAQKEVTIAFFSSEYALNNNYEKAIHDKIVSDLGKNRQANFLNYTWNQKTNEIGFNPNLNKEKKEKPADYLVFIKNDVVVNNNPEVQFRTDTSSNIIECWIPLKYQSIISYKVVDFKTSEILHFKNFDNPGFSVSNPGLVKVKDFKKYYGKNIKNLAEKKKQAIGKKVVAAYQPTIKKKYDQANQEVVKDLNYIPSSIIGLTDYNIYKIIGPDPETVDGKLKELTIETKGAKDLNKWDYFSIYEIQTLGDYQFASFVSIAHTYEIKDPHTTLKTSGFTRKRTTEAYKSGNKIVVARNKKAVKNLNTLSEIDYRISVEKKCILCDSKLEERLSQFNNIELIERSHGQVMDFLIERYKSEKFLDFDAAQVQSAQQGVDILLSRNSKGIRLTEVKTGKVIDTSTKVYGMDVSSVLLDFSGQEIQFLDIVKKKKKKINSIAIYHPFGVSRLDRFKVCKLIEENVRGEIMERKETISQGYLHKELGVNVGNLNIQKGKKELFEALEKGEKIVILPE